MTAREGEPDSIGPAPDRLGGADQGRRVEVVRSRRLDAFGPIEPHPDADRLQLILDRDPELGRLPGDHRGLLEIGWTRRGVAETRLEPAPHLSGDGVAQDGVGHHPAAWDLVADRLRDALDESFG